MPICHLPAAVVEPSALEFGYTKLRRWKERYILLSHMSNTREKTRRKPMSTWIQNVLIYAHIISYFNFIFFDISSINFLHYLQLRTPNKNYKVHSHIKCNLGNTALHFFFTTKALMHSEIKKFLVLL